MLPAVCCCMNSFCYDEYVLCSVACQHNETQESLNPQSAYAGQC